jgi:hypothetical protein
MTNQLIRTVLNNFDAPSWNFKRGDEVVIDTSIKPTPDKLVFRAGNIELFSNQPEIDGVVLSVHRNV